MNIFILDKDVKENAKMYCDKHLVKMILESAQILCTVASLKGSEVPYRPTHHNHPSVLWVLESGFNWDYLVKLSEALNLEYRYRYERKYNHRSYDVIESLERPEFSSTSEGSYCAVVDEVFRGDLDEVIRAYREYYRKKSKEIKMSWRNREVPEFMKVKEVS